MTDIGHRFLVASDGLWIELRRSWLHVVTRIAANDVVKMPFGELSESISVPYPIPTQLLKQFGERACASHDVEQAALITFNNETKEFTLHDVRITSNGSSHVVFDWPRLSENEDFVLDIHSHAHHDAFFSSDDNEDDGHAVKFSAVIGHCHLPTVSSVMRLCLLGKYITLPPFGEIIQ